jgi:hypothetical protein
MTNTTIFKINEIYDNDYFMLYSLFLALWLFYIILTDKTEQIRRENRDIQIV